jgi:hypothetical protein
MADEITLEQDLDGVLGGLQAPEGDVVSSPQERSDLGPEDGPEEDEDARSEGDDGDT